MKLYIITYYIKKDSSFSEKFLTEVLHSFGDWLTCTPNTCIIYTNKNAKEIYTVIANHIDPMPVILIYELSRDKQGLLPKKAWEWIDEKMKKIDNESSKLLL